MADQARIKGIQYEQIGGWFKIASSVTDRLHSQKSVFALLNLEQYVNGLIIQWNRVMMDQQVSHSLVIDSSALASSQMVSVAVESKTRLKELQNSQSQAFGLGFLDIHFYLICWDKIKRRLDQLLEEEPGLRSVPSYKRIRSILKQAKKARDFMEHLDEKNRQGQGVGMQGNDELVFRYVDTERKTKKDQPEKVVALGKAEVALVTKTYEEIIETLAKANPVTRS